MYIILGEVNGSTMAIGGWSDYIDAEKDFYRLEDKDYYDRLIMKKGGTTILDSAKIKLDKLIYLCYSNTHTYTKGEKIY